MRAREQQRGGAVPLSAVPSLERLVNLNEQSAQRFRQAADKIDDRPLAADLRVWAADHTRQADEIAARLEALGSERPEPDSHGYSSSVARLPGARASSRRRSYIVLTELERAEKQVRDEYERALASLADGDLQEMVQQHCRSIEAIHNRLGALRDARRKKK